MTIEGGTVSYDLQLHFLVTTGVFLNINKINTIFLSHFYNNLYRLLTADQLLTVATT